jgi:pantoate--beta-alanine ligase
VVRVIDRIPQLRKELDAARAAGRRVGLVPTMGALHEGHRSLIDRAVGECDLIAVTVFVNPLQFGPREDYATYPRDLDADVALAAAAGAGVVFAPPVGEMYPDPPLTSVHVAGLTEGLEGASRPGHFDGVATVVTKLLAVAGPCRAYFGEKDWQQLCVVRRLVHDLSLPAEVVACPTVREPDGLAVSSRNRSLSPDDRGAATVLHRALEAAATAVAAGQRDGDRLRALMREVVATEPRAALDYAEVAEPATLAPLSTVEGEARLLIAARLGTTRLIDNTGVSA